MSVKITKKVKNIFPNIDESVTIEEINEGIRMLSLLLEMKPRHPHAETYKNCIEKLRELKGYNTFTKEKKNG